MKFRLCLSAFAVLALAGCSEERKPAAPQGGMAAGEVLEGSVSDAMLPLDSVRSQPPLAPREVESGKGSASNSSGDAPSRRSSDTAPAASDEGPGDPPPAEKAAPAEATPSEE